MNTSFRHLNLDWNAEPNAPDSRVKAHEDTVVLSFLMNSFVFKKYSEDDVGTLIFKKCRMYRLGSPGVAPDVVAYYEDLFLRLSKTATWRKYLEEQQFEDGFQKSAELSKFFDTYTNQMRDILKEAGAKVVR